MKYVIVRLHGILDQGSSELHLKVEDVIKLSSLQQLAGVPAGQVGLALVNGELSWGDTAVQPGAVVDFYPTIAGG
jgi:molybdopterin converting factor small subunit